MVIRSLLTPSALLRWEVVKDLLPNGPSRILEVGPGSGGFSFLLAQDHSYLGYEPDRTSYDVATERLRGLPRAEIRNEPVTADTFVEGEFEVIVAFEVLEHLHDDVVALKTWIRWLAEGGLVIFSVPAHSSRYRCCDEMVGHQRRYDRSDLQDLLTHAGLIPINIISYGFPLTHATEWVRNVVCKRRCHSADVGTPASGRMFQPSKQWLGLLIRLGVWPFSRLQRIFFGTELGAGWVVAATRSA